MDQNLALKLHPLFQKGVQEALEDLINYRIERNVDDMVSSVNHDAMIRSQGAIKELQWFLTSGKFIRDKMK